jgi:hypothetical protein
MIPRYLSAPFRGNDKKSSVLSNFQGTEIHIQGANSRAERPTFLASLSPKKLLPQ